MLTVFEKEVRMNKLHLKYFSWLTILSLVSELYTKNATLEIHIIENPKELVEIRVGIP